MISTQTWRDRWRRTTTRKVVALVQIDFGFVQSLNQNLILRVATQQVRTDDDAHWEPLLVGEGNVHASSSFMSYDVDLASFTFSLEDRESALLGSGLRLSALLATNVPVIGAEVRLWLNELSAPFTTDALPRFVGVVQSYSASLGKLTFSCLQGRTWNRSITPRTVTRAEFPGAPEDAVGGPIPIVLGRVAGPPLRMPPYDAPYSDIYRVRELVTGGGRMGQAVVVDVGRSDVAARRSKVMVAGHKVAQFGNVSPNWGTSPFLEGEDGTRHSVDPAAADIFNDDTLGAGFYLPIGSLAAYYPLFPVAVESTTNPASGQQALLDRNNEVSFASFDYTALKRTIALRFPTTSDNGAIGLPGLTTNVYVVYRSSGNLGAFRAVVRNTKFGVGRVLSLPATASPFVPEYRSTSFNANDAVMPDMGAVGGGTASDSWDFGQWRVEFDFADTGTPQGWAEVYLCAAAVPYGPKREVLETKKIVDHVLTVRRRKRKTLFFSHGAEPPHTVYEERERVENITQLASRFFANVLGAPDDGVGTYTGTPNAVVERAADLYRYVLVRYGGVSDADIVTAPGDFGSVVDARALLRTWCNRDMVLGLYVRESLDLSAALPWLTGACVAQPIYTEHDGRWALVPWRVAPAVTYTMPISRDDLLDPDVGPAVKLAPDSSVLSALRLTYGWDAQKGAYAHEVSLSGSSSGSGHGYRNVRDGLMTVAVSVNDKLDFSTGSGTKTATLTAGLMDGWARALDVRSKLNTAEGAGDLFRVSYGPRVQSGYNDVVSWSDNGTLRNSSLGSVEWATFEDACAAVAAALNAFSGGWSVTYSRATGKVTVTRAPNFGSQVRNTGVGSVWAMLGFEYGDFNLPATSAVPVEERRYCIWHYATAVDLLWLSGPNGLNGTATSCWEVLGFDWLEDNLGRSVRHVWTGVSPKADLESLLATADALYGKKRPVTIEGRALYDTPTALEARNRVVALMRKPRAVVSFSSEVLADLRRGDVFQFAADMDSLMPYPVPLSDGSWAGKLFRVLETVQRFGTSWHTEVVAVDVTD